MQQAFYGMGDDRHSFLHIIKALGESYCRVLTNKVYFYHENLQIADRLFFAVLDSLWR